MKNFKSAFAYVVAISLVCAIVSCSKDGPMGPKGDTGANGTNGTAGTNGTNGNTGPAGPTGPKGDTGVANIIYSDWKDVTYLVDVNSSYRYYFDMAVPKLSATILNTGEVKVYINSNTAANPKIIPLPFYDGYNGSSINVSFELQKIKLTSLEDVSTITENGIKYRQYRYILIPGGVKGKAAIDWNNYESVKKYLKLKD